MANEQENNGFDKVVKVIDKGLDSRVYIRISEFRGQDYLHIRNYYLTDNDEWRPTRKGVALPVEFYDELMGGLEEARSVIEQRSKEETES